MAQNTKLRKREILSVFIYLSCGGTLKTPRDSLFTTIPQKTCTIVHPTGVSYQGSDCFHIFLRFRPFVFSCSSSIFFEKSK